MEPVTDQGGTIQPLQVQHCRNVARSHIEGISTGFISSLGEEFVTGLYEAIAEDPGSFGFVAVEQNTVLGFVAFSTRLSGLYKQVAMRKGVKFAFVVARRMLSVRMIKKVVDNLFYPSKMKKMDLPDAELLSIVVAPQGRGKGVAKSLVLAGLEECRKRGIDRVKVLVAAANEPANKLYQKCGFEFKMQIDHHHALSNIYVATVC